MRIDSLSVVVVLSAAGLAAGVAAAVDAPAPVDVPLTVRHADKAGRVNGYAYIPLDAQGTGELTFANTAGKLRVKSADGKVRVDVNGDGTLDDRDGPAHAPREPFKVDAAAGGRPQPYSLMVMFFAKEFAGFGSGSWLEGKVGDQNIRLYDRNLNGVFAEPGTDAVVLGEDGMQAPWTRLIDVDGRLHTAELAAGWTALRLAPYTGPQATLAIRASEAGYEVRAGLMETSGVAYAECNRGLPAACVPGTYGFQSLMLLSPAAGAPAQAARPVLLGEPAAGTPVTVAAGTNTLTYGPPFTLVFEAVREAGDQPAFKVTTVALVGKGGETYRAWDYSAPRNDCKLECLLRTGGGDEQLGSMEYG